MGFPIYDSGHAVAVSDAIVGFSIFDVLILGVGEQVCVLLAALVARPAEAALAGPRACGRGRLRLLDSLRCDLSALVPQLSARWQALASWSTGLGGEEVCRQPRCQGPKCLQSGEYGCGASTREALTAAWVIGPRSAGRRRAVRRLRCRLLGANPGAYEVLHSCNCLSPSRLCRGRGRGPLRSSTLTC